LLENRHNLQSLRYIKLTRSFRSLCYDRSIASSKASSPENVI